MPKDGEIAFVQNMGPDAVRHALGKPFSDPDCARYFLDFGVVFALLPPPPARVLDLGVGTGWTSELLARRGYDVLGQDISPDMIALAESRQPPLDAGKLRFVVCDYEALPFADEFDAVLFYDALHHAEDERAAFMGALRALKLGGVCVTVEPGRGHAQAAASIAQRYGITEKDMPPAHIIAVATALGFRDFEVYPRLTVYPGQTDVGVWLACRRFVRQLAKAFVGPWRERRRLMEGSNIVRMRK